MKDKREHKRYYLKALLQIADAGEYASITLEAINISAGGIFFRSNTDIPDGDTFSLTMSLPGHPEPVEARCRSIHRVETIPEKQYFIGAKFLALEGITQQKLKSLLRERFEMRPEQSR